MPAEAYGPFTNGARRGGPRPVRDQVAIATKFGFTIDPAPGSAAYSSAGQNAAIWTGTSLAYMWRHRNSSPAAGISRAAPSHRRTYPSPARPRPGGTAGRPGGHIGDARPSQRRTSSRDRPPARPVRGRPWKSTVLPTVLTARTPSAICPQPRTASEGSYKSLTASALICGMVETADVRVALADPLGLQGRLGMPLAAGGSVEVLSGGTARHRSGTWCDVDAASLPGPLTQVGRLLPIALSSVCGRSQHTERA